MIELKIIYKGLEKFISKKNGEVYYKINFLTEEDLEPHSAFIYEEQYTKFSNMNLEDKKTYKCTFKVGKNLQLYVADISLQK